jgi:lipopolysaccharide transport system permease protein
MRAMLWLVSPSQNWIYVRKIESTLWRNRHLVRELVRRELRSQFAGQAFGLFWILGHPLIQCVIYIFVFTVVFKTKIDQTLELPRDYTTYILVGVVPWLFVQQSLTRTASTLVAQANLVKQVVFPVEVLPFCAVLVSLIPLIVGLAVIAIYTLISQLSLPWTYLLLPLVVAATVALMTGIGLVLAVVTPFFRDIKDIIQVGTVVGVYIVPAFYLPQWVPQKLQFVIYLNPFSYLIWVYQDILYFGQIAHPIAWILVLGASFGILAVGYRAFGTLRSFVADVL